MKQFKSLRKQRGYVILPYLAYVAEAAAVVGAGVSAYESIQSGNAQASQAKQQARVEADKEAQNQIQMRQRMLAALATQNAQAGVGGIGTGKNTSFGANTMRQISQAQNDLLVSRANSSAQVSILDQAAANDQTAGIAGAASDVLSGVGKAAGIARTSG